MDKRWLRPVEKIVLLSGAAETRIIGFTSLAPQCGVSTLSAAVGELFALSGFKTLVIDTTAAAQESWSAGWYPGDGDHTTKIQRREQGFDCMVARFTTKSKYAFNHVEAFQKCVRVDFHDYERVVLDLPPVVGFGDDQVNPAALAAACDAVYLVCVPGQVTQAVLRSAVDLIKAAGGSIDGLVLNEFSKIGPGQDLARIARKLFRRNPAAAERLADRALSSWLLNP